MRIGTCFVSLPRATRDNIAGPAEYVPLQSLVDEDFNLVALKAAATRGRLDAIRGADDQWRSSRMALATLKDSRFKRSSS